MLNAVGTGLIADDSKVIEVMVNHNTSYIQPPVSVSSAILETTSYVLNMYLYGVGKGVFFLFSSLEQTHAHTYIACTWNHW